MEETILHFLLHVLQSNRLASSNDDCIAAPRRVALGRRSVMNEAAKLEGKYYVKNS
jgi:hypothetical protein